MYLIMYESERKKKYLPWKFETIGLGFIQIWDSNLYYSYIQETSNFEAVLKIGPRPRVCVRCQAETNAKLISWCSSTAKPQGFLIDKKSHVEYKSII